MAKTPEKGKWFLLLVARSGFWCFRNIFMLRNNVEVENCKTIYGVKVLKSGFEKKVFLRNAV